LQIPCFAVTGGTVSLECRLFWETVSGFMTVKREKVHKQNAHWSEKGCHFLHFRQYMPADRICSGTLCISIAFGLKKNLHHKAGDDFFGIPISQPWLFECCFNVGTFVFLQPCIGTDTYNGIGWPALSDDSK
jgi:hypothetical protein